MNRRQEDKDVNLRFIYHAINQIASRRHHPFVEQCLAEAVEDRLLTVGARLRIEREQKLKAKAQSA